MANLNKISTFATSNIVPHYIFYKIIGLTQLPFRGLCVKCGVIGTITYYILYV